MQQSTVPVEGRTVADLDDFLGSTQAGGLSVTYRGVTLHKKTVGAPGAIVVVLIVALLYAAYERTTSAATIAVAVTLAAIVWRLLIARSRGLHVVVELPVSLATDLRLESRRWMRRARKGDACAPFTCSAANVELARQEIGPVLWETLCRLDRDYVVLMTDSTIQIGPFDNGMQSAVEAVDRLVGAVRARSVPSPPSAVVAEPADELVVVAATSSRAQMDLWRSLLEAAGVTIACRGYEVSPPWGTATPPREMTLLVAAGEELRARELLAGAQREAGSAATCFYCGEVVALGAERCPSCQHDLREKER